MSMNRPPLAEGGNPFYAPEESVRLAKIANRRERAQFTAETGLELDEEGHVGLLMGRAIALAVLQSNHRR